MRQCRGAEGRENVQDKGLPGQERSEAHVLMVHNREQVTVQGVIGVDSFDDQEIVLNTEQGVLTLKGEELHIRQLDLESGNFLVEGFLTAAIYSGGHGKGLRGAKSRGFFERLLR